MICPSLPLVVFVPHFLKINLQNCTLIHYLLNYYFPYIKLVDEFKLHVTKFRSIHELLFRIISGSNNEQIYSTIKQNTLSTLLKKIYEKIIYKIDELLLCNYFHNHSRASLLNHFHINQYTELINQ